MIDKIKDLWSLESPLLAFLRKIGWVFLINLLFLFTSIPLVTVGASMVGMHLLFYKMIEERDFAFFKDYFRSFREKFVRATILWLICLVCAGVLVIDVVYVFFEMTGGFALFMKLATIALCIFFVAISNAVFPLLMRYDMGVTDVIKTAVGMLLEHVGLAAESVAFTVVIFGGSLLILYEGWFAGLFILFPLISFGLHAFMQSYLFRQLFSYYEEEEEEEESRL